MICFQETTDSGFGDRLRGIAYLLHLSHVHGEAEILYNDEDTVRDLEKRNREFPGRLTDLIRLDGLSFEYHPLPLPDAEVSVVYDSQIDRKKENRRGFRHFRRLRPRDDAVASRVEEVGVDRSRIGFQVRRTDNVGLSRKHFALDWERRALKNLRCASLREHTRKVFLAADNGRSIRRWRRILERAGYDVLTSDVVHDPDSFRQTGNFDMMVDFFCLARCRRIVRAVPSEFSRFAAWVGGRRMKYSQLR